MGSSSNVFNTAFQHIQSMAAQAASHPQAVTADRAAGSFAGVLKASLDKISMNQNRALSQAHAFELGLPHVSLNNVMVDMQKANVGFQFGLQVRNKLVNAYHEIMQISV